jgi:hypothetical protein
MRAVVWKKPYTVEVEEVKDPRVEEPTDAILRLTTARRTGTPARSDASDRGCHPSDERDRVTRALSASILRKTPAVSTRMRSGYG